MSRRRITLEFVPEGSTVELDAALTHYLGRVLRLGSGTELDVVDAAGARWCGRVVFDGVGARVEGLSLGAAAQRVEPLWVLASLIKQTPWEWMLEKATELGVTDIVPIAAARSVVRIDASKADSKRERWQRICDSAVRQSERAHRVHVHAPRDFAAAVEEAAASGRRLVYLDETRPETPWPQGAALGGLTFVTGPEGGMVDEERGLLERAGGVGVGLGPALLKAETATIAALSYVRLARGGLVP